MVIVNRGIQWKCNVKHYTCVNEFGTVVCKMPISTTTAYTNNIITTDHTIHKKISLSHLYNGLSINMQDKFSAEMCVCYMFP